MCNRSLKHTAISLSSCQAEFYAASACAWELLGLAELFKKLHCKVSVRLEMDPNSARHILQRRGQGRLKHIEIRCLSIQQWIRDKRLSVSRVDTKNNTAELFTKHLDGFRSRALAKKLRLRFVDMADGGTNGNGRWWQLTAFNKRLQLSRCVSFFSFDMWSIVHCVDIDICTLTPSLPCRCLPCCLFFSSSACPQTDTAQLYNTHPDSFTHMDRTGLEFHFVFAKTREVQTVILTTSDLRRCGIVNGHDRRISGCRAAQGPERLGQAAVVWWKRCRVPRLSIQLQNTHEPRQFCFLRDDEVDVNDGVYVNDERRNFESDSWISFRDAQRELGLGTKHSRIMGGVIDSTGRPRWESKHVWACEGQGTSKTLRAHERRQSHEASHCPFRAMVWDLRQGQEPWRKTRQTSGESGAHSCDWVWWRVCNRHAWWSENFDDGCDRVNSWIDFCSCGKEKRRPGRFCDAEFPKLHRSVGFGGGRIEMWPGAKHSWCGKRFDQTVSIHSSDRDCNTKRLEKGSLRRRERANLIIQGQLRAFREAVSMKYKTEVGPDHVLMGWMVRHCVCMGCKQFPSEGKREDALS